VSGDGIRLYRSSILPSDGFVHGFPERTGGVSTGPRSSLNLGFRWGDERAAVEENRRLLAAHVGYDPDQLQVTKHVHGTAVWKVGEPLPDPAEFDGLVCDRPGPVLGAFAADCIPMLFADPVARVCGACHAGWRGTVAGVARNVVGRMVERGARAADIRVALGPSIGPCCFEVGPEVLARFDHLGDGISAGRMLDLREVARRLLADAGVDDVDATELCTSCEGDLFFSHRRDRGRTGRQAGLVWIRPDA
jgi:YfiH family protein